MSTWEERMSARAKKAQQALEDRAYKANQASEAAEQSKLIDAYAEDLTPERAQSIIDDGNVPCACMGGPNCCVIRYGAALKVLGKE